jgi:hypothetical protein
MQRKYFLIFFSILTIGILSYYFSRDQTISGPKIKADQARQIASRITGFSLENEKGLPQLITVEVDIPFVKQNKSTQLWSINFKDYLVKSKKGLITSDKLDFNVFIDAETGQFIMARWVSKTPAEYAKPLPPSSVAEKQLESINTSYLEFVQTPTVSLSNALDELSANFGQITSASSEVTAICVVEKSTSYTGPMWVITTSGMPVSGMAARRPEIPLWERTSLTHSINATTGKWFRASNKPHWIELAKK